MTVKEEIALRLNGVTSAEIKDMKEREKLEKEPEVKEEPEVKKKIEPDPRDKEIETLKKQVADLQKAKVNEDISGNQENITYLDMGVDIVNSFLH